MFPSLVRIHAKYSRIRNLLLYYSLINLIFSTQEFNIQYFRQDWSFGDNLNKKLGVRPILNHYLHLSFQWLSTFKFLGIVDHPMGVLNFSVIILHYTACTDHTSLPQFNTLFTCCLHLTMCKTHQGQNNRQYQFFLMVYQFNSPFLSLNGLEHQ